MLEEKVLLFNPHFLDMSGKIYKALQKFGTNVQIVKAEEFTIPLGMIAYGQEEEKEKYAGKKSNQKMDSTMMVLAGFTEPRLKALLGYFRTEGLPVIPLKAGLTPYNATWNAYELFEELKKEDAYYKNRK